MSCEPGVPISWESWQNMLTHQIITIFPVEAILLKIAYETSFIMITITLYTLPEVLFQLRSCMLNKHKWVQWMIRHNIAHILFKIANSQPNLIAYQYSPHSRKIVIVKICITSIVFDPLWTLWICHSHIRIVIINVIWNIIPPIRFGRGLSIMQAIRNYSEESVLIYHYISLSLSLWPCEISLILYHWWYISWCVKW